MSDETGREVAERIEFDPDYWVVDKALSKAQTERLACLDEVGRLPVETTEPAELIVLAQWVYSGNAGPAIELYNRFVPPTEIKLDTELDQQPGD